MSHAMFASFAKLSVLHLSMTRICLAGTLLCCALRCKSFLAFRLLKIFALSHGAGEPLAGKKDMRTVFSNHTPQNGNVSCLPKKPPGSL